MVTAVFDAVPFAALLLEAKQETSEPAGGAMVRNLALYEIFIISLHIPYGRSATISNLTDCVRAKYEMGSGDRGDAYTDGDHDARNASAGGL